MALQHLRSSTADKRPTPAAMSDGQLALNTNLVSPGLFFKDSNGDSVKIGPVHVGTTAPNVTPGAGGQAGNSKGEAWLDTTATNPILKVWNGSAFVAVQPVGTGTVVSTTDSGTVTSTMILDGTILNADINASAAIAGTKISPNFGSQNVVTTGNVQAASINNGPLAGFRNAIVNGSFAVAQRGTSFTGTGGGNDDTKYNLDRWYILSDGNDVVDITQTTSVIPTNGKYAIALDVETINKKFGVNQIIEANNCTGLIGETVTLSFKARVSATTKLDNVKAAIVAWSGTADSIPGDIISAWGAEGTNPTLIANATYENSPVNLNLTTSYATYSITAAVDTASAKNIMVFIWSDVTDTTLGDFLYITDVQLEPGPVATPFERRPIGTELALAQRYFEKSYNISVAPGTVTNDGVMNRRASNTNEIDTIPFKQSKRGTPSITFYNPATGGSGTWRDGSAATDRTTTTGTGTGEGSFAFVVTASVDGNQLTGHWTASAEL